VAAGEGASKKKAEQLAAQAALLQLRTKDEAVAG
jgi:dsRNA-specific ribonuclease